MAYPTLPEEAQRQLDAKAEQFSVLIHTHKYSEALNVIMKLHELMINWQKTYGKSWDEVQVFGGS